MAKQRKSYKQAERGGAMRLKKRPDPMLMQNGDGVWDTIKEVAGKANKFLRDTKLLSTVAGLVPVQTPYIGRVASVAAPALKSLGYGKQQILGVPNQIGGMRYDPVGQTSVMSGKGKKKVINA